MCYVALVGTSRFNFASDLALTWNAFPVMDSEAEAIVIRCANKSFGKTLPPAVGPLKMPVRYVEQTAVRYVSTASNPSAWAHSGEKYYHDAILASRNGRRGNGTRDWRA